MPRQRRLNRVPVFAKGQAPPMNILDSMKADTRLNAGFVLEGTRYALNRFNEITEARPDISLAELYEILKSDFDKAKEKYEAA